MLSSVSLARRSTCRLPSLAGSSRSLSSTAPTHERFKDPLSTPEAFKKWIKTSPQAARFRNAKQPKNWLGDTVEYSGRVYIEKVAPDACWCSHFRRTHRSSHQYPSQTHSRMPSSTSSWPTLKLTLCARLPASTTSVSSASRLSSDSRG